MENIDEVLKKIEDGYYQEMLVSGSTEIEVKAELIRHYNNATLAPLSSLESLSQLMDLWMLIHTQYFEYFNRINSNEDGIKN